jgi:hypothetical protein
VLDPSILKTEHPPRHPCSINVVNGLKGTRPAVVPLTPAGAGSFFDPKRKSRSRHSYHLTQSKAFA